MDAYRGPGNREVVRRRGAHFWAHPGFIVLAICLTLGIAVSGWLGYQAYDNLFGADSCNATLSETWLGNGASWTRQSVENGPSSRTNPAMAYDPSSKHVILFGGIGPPTISNHTEELANLTDTWAWNGSTWRRVATTVNPPTTFGEVLVYDPALGHLVLVDAPDNSTPTSVYEWLGDDWQLINDSGPSGAYGGSAVYDGALNALVLIVQESGVLPTQQEAWSFDGRIWHTVAPPMLGLQGSIVVGYDPNIPQVVLYVGFDTATSSQSETWVFDGETWRDASQPHGPNGVPGFAYVDHSGHVIVMAKGELWDWSGTDWSDAGHAASVRRASAAVVDPARQQVVAYVGAYPDCQVL